MTTSKRGIEVLQDPLLNKSTAFAESEKEALGLVGIVPDATETEDLQLQRVMLQLAAKPTDLERYIYLINLLDHNETRPAFCQSCMTLPSGKHASSLVTSIGSRMACISPWPAAARSKKF
jgi:hypothetical protein